jgi:flagellar basal-body rod modification protein FlgD
MDIQPNIQTNQAQKLSFKLTPDQAERLTLENDSFNKTLNQGRIVNKELGKDDFLKLLIAQLSHQDPTQPLEDKEFIAQMAQFSTLEQVTNLSGEMTKLASHFQKNEALSLLGKVVEIVDGDKTVKGKVEKIKGGDIQQVFVAGKYYDYQAVDNVSEDTQPVISAIGTTSAASATPGIEGSLPKAGDGLVPADTAANGKDGK